MPGGARVLGRCPALVHRDYELARLSELAAAAAESRRVVVITGEAGVGKTRLADEVLATLPANWTTERVRPGGPSPLLPLLEAGTTSVGAFVDALAARQPVAVLVDDLHAHAPEAVAMLRAAGERLAGVAALIVATFRLGTHAPGSPMAAATARLLREPWADELPLSPLSREGVATMVDLMGSGTGTGTGTGGEARIAELHRRTQGNPLFVEAVLRGEGDELPWTVTEAVLDVFAPLDDDARRVAQSLAVAGLPLPYRTLVALSPDLDDALVALEAAAVLAEPAQGVFTLRHGLVGEVLVAAMAPGVLRQRRRAVAEAIETHGPHMPAAMVRLWLAAGDEERAAAWAARISAAAREDRGPLSTIEVFDVALRHPPTDPLTRGGMYERAAVAAWSAAETGRARAWALEADAAYRASSEPWRASAMWLNPLLRFMDEQRDRHTAGVPAHDARVLAKEADDAIRAGEPERAAPLARAAIEASEAAGDLLHAAHAADLLFGAGVTAEATTVRHRLIERARASGDTGLQATFLTQLSDYEAAFGDWSAVIRTCREAHAVALSDEATGVWHLTTFYLAGTLALAGYVAEASSHLPALDGIGTGQGLFMAGSVRMAIAAARGEAGAVREALDRMSVVRQFGLNPITVTVITADAVSRALAGDGRRATELLDEIDAGYGFRYDRNLPDRLLARGLAAAALADVAALARAADTARDVARAAPRAGLQAVAQEIAARSILARDGAAAALPALESTAEMWERAPRYTYAARAWVDAGEAAVAAGEPARAGRAADRAQRLADEFGVGPPADRLDAVRARAATAAHRLPPALARLTPREREIVALVADHLTNQEIADRLFVSEKTVRNALTNIYAKLGLARRREIIDLIKRVSPPPS